MIAAKLLHYQVTGGGASRSSGVCASDSRLQLRRAGVRGWLHASGAETCDLSRALATAQLLGNARCWPVATLDRAQATLATSRPPLLRPLPRRLSQGGGEASRLECLATPTHQPSLMRLESVRVIFRYCCRRRLGINNRTYKYGLCRWSSGLFAIPPFVILDESLQGASDGTKAENSCGNKIRHGTASAPIICQRVTLLWHGQACRLW